jgi:hypothetical protein
MFRWKNIEFKKQRGTVDFEISGNQILAQYTLLKKFASHRILWNHLALHNIFLLSDISEQD